jgi:hypothetical protein
MVLGQARMRLGKLDGIVGMLQWPANEGVHDDDGMGAESRWSRRPELRWWLQSLVTRTGKRVREPVRHKTRRVRGRGTEESGGARELGRE